jgi:DNA-binding MarR family transcriptional regulator
VTFIPLPPLLGEVKVRAFEEFHKRLEQAGYGELREGHGCVFRFVQEEGSRLTDLAERSHLTKQAVGEVVDELERLGYVERTPDPQDGRAKVIRLTARGRDAQATALRIFAELEQDWGERIGRERVAALREALEALAVAELTAA